jgi:hypothetical protein
VGGVDGAGQGAIKLAIEARRDRGEGSGEEGVVLDVDVGNERGEI